MLIWEAKTETNIYKRDKGKTKSLPDCIVKTINVEDSIHIASVCVSFSVLFLKKSTDTQGLSIKFFYIRMYSYKKFMVHNHGKDVIKTS